MCLSVIEFPLRSAALYVVGIGSSLAPWIDGMVAGAGVGVGVGVVLVLERGRVVASLGHVSNSDCV